MKLNKRLTAISAVALMGIAPFASKTVQAADSSTINKTIMHNSAVYDKNGKDTGKMYKSYQKVIVESGIVKINGGQYYKLADKDQYIKITNIDGVERTVEHNAYVYATSTRRANRRLVKKGTTIVTYGGSYKFKNGKRYYRVGGPAKQYVKVANLGDVVTTSTSSNSSNSTVTNNSTNTSTTNNSKLSSSDGETTITVTEPYPYLVGILDKNGKVIQHNIKKGTKFIADRREITKFASEFPPGSITKGFYRIKGTNHWISAAYVKADKELPLYNYNDEHYSYIKFIQPTYVYNADGTIKSIPNKEVRKHGEFYKVDDLKYIWVPSENKAELFYRLPVTVAMGMYELGYSYSDTLKIKDIYVKADDVKFVEGIKLTPSNTPEEAKAAYEANQTNTAVVNSNN